ncbi:MAG: hypothetical protein WCS30_02790 [Selenomonadaceae bacterium]
MEKGLDLPEQVEADVVIVEVVDKSTGKLFRRKLPLQYLENCNGIILSGETMDGKPSQIHFLSAAALVRINELTGKGPDQPKCKDH